MTTEQKIRDSYCNSLTEYSRFRTRVVNIGGLPMGGDNPIRVQSMTVSDTMNTKATVEETIRLAEVGCDYVRITAPSLKEAENLDVIKKEVRSRGYSTPLIADIHFTPNAAELAAKVVEKVRVNPGNYADKKKFQQIEYTDQQYLEEIERIRERFLPLVKICKQYGTAMRIGTNHGSLSDRIMSRYGDTPIGMVESALEFARICREENYHELVFSMKASNPQVMIQAYRLLVNKMIEENMDYPLHLGVTEAGDGEDGRIKSAMGIGTLLEDGLGDTIRVSLTEAPEAEVPVAINLVNRYSKRKGHISIPPIEKNPINAFHYQKRKTKPVLNIGGDNVPRVMSDFSYAEKVQPADFQKIGYVYDEKLDKWHIDDIAADYIYMHQQTVDFNIPGTLGLVYDYTHWRSLPDKDLFYPQLKIQDFMHDEVKLHKRLNFIYATLTDLQASFLEKLKNTPSAVLLIDTFNEHGYAEQRRLFIELLNHNVSTPVIIGKAYEADLTQEQFQLFSSTDIGGLLVDGLGDGIFLAPKARHGQQLANQTAFGILQASRTRISRTEYISCPSCGRTLFDLQETTAMIKAKTDHLKGVKIGIMGCIVNGPGEMADADYGYVGSGIGKITLYRGQEVVKRGVPSEQAVGELIEIIRKDGNWVDV